ncbi:MAG: dethiobiotin synthase [Bacteroidetes bacterium]|nr:MAG: dethiobiotin synthase [Bacteroidota bacterium]
MEPIVFFVTGIGTGIGKTVCAAIIAESLGYDYWKPVQAGFEDGTDTEWVKTVITDGSQRVHAESYKLKMPASPHIAAREESLKISLPKIKSDFESIRKKITDKKQGLVIEGAGGLLVPLNENEFVIDLAQSLNAKLILVSKNYLGSINHSLLTASVIKSRGIPVEGWIFNDQFMNYEKEIVEWTGYPNLGSIPRTSNLNSNFISEQASKIRANFFQHEEKGNPPKI